MNSFLPSSAGRTLRAVVPLLLVVGLAAQDPSPARGSTNAEAPRLQEKREHGLIGLAVPKESSLVRSYEPTQIGWTKDEHDDGFMDFTFSAMFPLIWGDYVTDKTDDHGESIPYTFKDSKFSDWNLFFSGTLRAGQYIKTRASSPVVGKRFNPQVFVRWWLVDQKDGRGSRDKYVDFIPFGHESNGESLSTPNQVEAQRLIYLSLYQPAGVTQWTPTPEALRKARLGARDAISRGWDYIGAEGSWSWQRNVPDNIRGENYDFHYTSVLRVKLRYFLPTGLAQGDAEEYHDWEGTVPGLSLPRRNYDGILIQYTTHARVLSGTVPFLTGRATLTYTTGYGQPFRHSTIEADLGGEVRRVPFSFWARYGYNSDLTDYYLRDTSFGVRISIWRY